MKAVKGNDEYKQRINLSNYAATILWQDYENYSASMPVAGFLNNIIKNFKAKAKASIDYEVQRYQKRLEDTLSIFGEESMAREIIERLTAEYRSELIQKMRTAPLPKGESILFRLNKENFETLYGKDGTNGIEASNYSRPSLYLKALFEEFTRLPTCERECFYFTNIITDVEDIAIPNGYLLEITLGKHRYIMRPYKILSDTEQTHLYLAGKSTCVTEPNSHEKIASFRITNLSREIKILKEDARSPLSKDDIADIEDKIRKVGIQFLVAEPTSEVKLRFHYSGEKLFKQKTHLRPVPVTISEDGVYTFDCSIQQIANYFFSFGRNVEILSPEKLRNDFMVGYQRAYETYK